MSVVYVSVPFFFLLLSYVFQSFLCLFLSLKHRVKQYYSRGLSLFFSSAGKVYFGFHSYQLKDGAAGICSLCSLSFSSLSFSIPFCIGLTSFFLLSTHHSSASRHSLRLPLFRFHRREGISCFCIEETVRAIHSFFSRLMKLLTSYHLPYSLVGCTVEPLDSFALFPSTRTSPETRCMYTSA